jgi:hypothetical protein
MLLSTSRLLLEKCVSCFEGVFLAFYQSPRWVLLRLFGTLLFVEDGCRVHHYPQKFASTENSGAPMRGVDRDVL